MRRRIAAALRSIRAFAYIAMSIANVIALPVRAAMIPRPETPCRSARCESARGPDVPEAESIGPFRALVA
jgi:hypothetical protein